MTPEILNTFKQQLEGIRGLLQNETTNREIENPVRQSIQDAEKSLSQAVQHLTQAAQHHQQSRSQRA